MFKRIKRANWRLKIISFAVLILGGALVSVLVLAYGQNNNRDGLVVDLDLTQANYNAATKVFTDKSGNGNHGVSTNNAVFTADKDGKSNSAMTFNGLNDQIMINHSTSYKNPSVTVSFWFRPLDQSKRHVLVTTWSGFTTELNSDRTFRWGLTGPPGQYYGTKKINWGEWVYLTSTFDNSTKQQCIYINGVQQECQTVSGSIAYDVNHLYVSGAWDRVKGDFGNIKVYNRALSSFEIKGLYRDTKAKFQVASLEKGLVASFPLDGENFNASNNRVTDKSAYSNHGVAYLASLTSDRFNRASGAMSFNGSSSYIGGNLGNNISNSPFSISAFVKLSSTSTAQYFSVGQGGLRQAIHLRFISPTSFRFGMYSDDLTATINDALDRWTHLVVTLDNNFVQRIYQDGVLISSRTAGGYFTGDNAWNIGRWILTGTESFKGSIADVRVYKRSLNIEEILNLYNSYKSKTSVSSLQKGLVLDMPLTSKYTKSVTVGSEIMTDLSPYSHNGQNYGGVVSAEGTALINAGNRVETSFSVPNDQGTISIWYKPVASSTNASRNSVLYSTGNSWVANSFELALRNCCGDPYDNVLYMMAANNSYLRFEWDVPRWPANQWINLTVVYDSRDYIRPYVNGVLATTSMAVNSADFNFPAVFNIGARGAGATSAGGTVSDLKVYNRAFSAEEIRLLYDKGRGRSGAILNGL
jgi:hypothetical protein